MHNLLYLLASSVFSKQALKSLGKLRFTEFHEIAKILSDSSSQALSADDGHTARHSILFHRFHLFQVVILLLRFSRFPTATSHSPRPTRYSFSHNPRHSFKTLDSRNPKPPADSETPQSRLCLCFCLLLPVPHARYLLTAILLCGDRHGRHEIE